MGKRTSTQRSSVRKQQEFEPTKQMKRSSSLPSLTVRFDRLVIHRFERTIGDSPAVSGGVPISMSMRPLPNVEPTVVDIDLYEQHRQPHRNPRRSAKQLILKRGEREQILLDRGYTQQEIDDAAREAKKYGRKVRPLSKSETRRLDGIQRQAHKSPSSSRKLLLSSSSSSSSSSSISSTSTESLIGLSNITIHSPLRRHKSTSSLRPRRHSEHLYGHPSQEEQDDPLQSSSSSLSSINLPSSKVFHATECKETPSHTLMMPMRQRSLVKVENKTNDTNKDNKSSSSSSSTQPVKYPQRQRSLCKVEKKDNDAAAAAKSQMITNPGTGTKQPAAAAPRRAASMRGETGRFRRPSSHLCPSAMADAAGVSSSKTSRRSRSFVEVIHMFEASKKEHATGSGGEYPTDCETESERTERSSC